MTVNSQIRTPLLQIADLVTRFGKFRALDGVSVEVGESQAIGLVGPNGSGKTTLVNTVCGLYPSASGSIHFAGTNLTGKRADIIAKAGINRTFQISKPFASLTVRENVEVAAHHARHPRDVDEVLEQTDLASHSRASASNLTAAQQKRLDLARALVMSPRLLFIDELAAGLTPNELQDVAAMLRNLVNDGVSLVVVEHLMGFLEQVVDGVYVLTAGQVIFRGPLRDALADDRVQEVFLGRNDSARS
ncbi:ATP-binding cassette domain-containing protein [Ferrimicrobium sp.]|uniref:ABC transporter ATP-binding protein n=1 Tax=Ferrimicrobium sp. TaxID=2926050 RepID=UPI00260DA25C|nr:ATP-binding cassette domain-containing protein [Ferrimicrobium sp.]